ncbi:MAG: pseudouridine-5'-phosphate glycosidase [Rhodovibrionaceae bacterium]
MRISLSPEIATAQAQGRPVVALESTVVAHGMPSPVNLEVARETLAAVRAAGALPAMIGIVAGELIAGLSEEQIADFARRDDAEKVSRRDLAAVIAAGRNGATTVAATMIAAHLAGIRVFATGGIGGVHRGAERSFDVSADLTELGRTPVAVVSAGAKAILDLPRSLEVLETLGVPVAGYGTGDFPAFYSRSSGLPVSVSVADAAEAAALLRAHWTLGLQSGVLIANPIPEAAEMTDAESFIAQAVAEAEDQGVSGKQVTPFLLGRLAELSEGRTQAANRALIVNNARVAAEIAVELAK